MRRCPLEIELLEGASLAEVQSALESHGDALPPSERHALVARIVADAADALHAAREAAGSDSPRFEVTPRSVLVGRDGVTRIVDRCAARGPTFGSSLGAACRHVAYVAPETLRGESPDPRGDVWALGVLLWESLTGQRLFERATVHETLSSVATDSVLAPSCIDVTIPSELDAIALRALDRDRSERWPTPEALSRALHAFLAGVEMPDVGALVQWLLPPAASPDHERESALPVLLPAAPVFDAASAARLFRALISRPVLVAMALGLVVGLGGTFVAIQLEGAVAARAAASAPASTVLEGVPRSMPVPDDERARHGHGAEASIPASTAIPEDGSDQQRPQVPEQQSRSGASHTFPQLPQ